MIEITAAEYERLQDCIREDGLRIASLIEENKALHQDAKHLTAAEYQVAAMRTSNDKLTIRDHVLNGALGLFGEGGEVADLIKKAYMQGHPLDKAHIAEELGDVCWYVAEMATALGCSVEEIMRGNIDKLRRRYPDGFDAGRSINREGSGHEPPEPLKNVP